MKGETAQQILDVAQDIVRNRGYSAFSYADIAEQVGIRKASIHYHFAAKEDLVKALVNRYRETFRRIRHQIEQTANSPDQQLMQFANLYRDGLQQERLCLCGMLAADFVVLPQAVQDEIKAFFAENENWLQVILQRGFQANVLHCRHPIDVEAKRILATLQGAQLIARASDSSVAVFEAITQPLLADLLPNR